MRLALSLVLVLLGACASEGSAPLHKSNHPTAQTTFLAEVALNGSAASRTFTIDNTKGGYAYANLEIFRTRSAGTDFSMTCVSTTGTETPTAVRPTCSFDSSGVCELKTAQLNSETSSTEAWAIDLRILGWKSTDCTFVSTAAAAGDTVEVLGALVTQ